MDDPDAIIREINYILQRNKDTRFLRKAMTWLLALEKKQAIVQGPEAYSGLFFLYSSTTLSTKC